MGEYGKDPLQEDASSFVCSLASFLPLVLTIPLLNTRIVVLSISGMVPTMVPYHRCFFPSETTIDPDPTANKRGSSSSNVWAMTHIFME